MNKSIKKMVRGMKAVDGAGVNLVRVLGIQTVKDFDPFLMLDSFDSRNPEDYIKGFPTHPHRGIETITYLIGGAMEHEDSLGNKGTIHPGESQWMTAGSGIMHQEMPLASERMLGVQLWLNLPRDKKMTPPAYFDVREDMMGLVELPNATLRVLAGQYQGNKGVQAPHHPVTIYDISLKAGTELSIDSIPDDNVFVFLIDGDGIIGGQDIKEKTAVLFEQEGSTVTVSATKQLPLRFLYLSGKPLNEPISWGGPIVMNTKDELNQAFAELSEGTFVK